MTKTDVQALTDAASKVMAKPEADHFLQHWLGVPPGNEYWPLLVPAPLIRRALVEVCERYRTTAVPCEFFWVFSGGNATARWEITIAEGQGQIGGLSHTRAGLRGAAAGPGLALPLGG